MGREGREGSVEDRGVNEVEGRADLLEVLEEGTLFVPIGVGEREVTGVGMGEGEGEGEEETGV